MKDKSIVSPTDLIHLHTIIIDVDAIWKVHASRHSAYECNIWNVWRWSSVSSGISHLYIMSLSIGSWLEKIFLLCSRLLDLSKSLSIIAIWILWHFKQFSKNYSSLMYNWLYALTSGSNHVPSKVGLTKFLFSITAVRCL